jgi:hypothetical protein
VTNKSNTLSGRFDAVRDWWAKAPHWQRWIVYIGLIVGALILPAPAIGSFMSPYSDWTTVLIFPVGTYMLMAIGLNVVVGMAGLLDLGFVAFFAIGAYSLAYFGTEYGWNFWPSSPSGSARSSGSPRTTPTRSAARAASPTSRTRHPCSALSSCSTPRRTTTSCSSRSCW